MKKILSTLKPLALGIYLKYWGGLFPNQVIPVLWKLLFTPRKRELKPPHLECLAQAVPFKFNSADGLGKMVRIAGYKWGEGNARKILLVHGWEGVAADFYKLIPVLTAQSFEVVSFDAPAHGDSSGKQTNLFAFMYAIHQCLEEIEKPEAIIGHSMGGSATVFALQRFSVHVNQLVLLATPTIVKKNFFEGAFDYLKLSKKIREKFYKAIEDTFQERLNTYDMTTIPPLKEVKRSLVAYDKQDHIVRNYTDIEKFISHNPHIEALEVKGAGHYHIIRDEKVIQQVVDFIK